MHLDSDSTFQDIFSTLDQPEHLDLDELRSKLQLLSAQWSELQERADLYEDEMQRELRAKIDLCGGIPGCPDSAFASTLNGEELLAARRAASLQFNRVFYMAPLTRNAIAQKQLRENSRNLINDVRLRAQKNL